MFNFFDLIFNFWFNALGPFGFDAIWLSTEDGIGINLFTSDWGERITIYTHTPITLLDCLGYLLTIITITLVFYMIYKIIKLIICRISGC